MLTLFILLVFVTSFQRKPKISRLHFATGSSPFTDFHCQKSDSKSFFLFFFKNFYFFFLKFAYINDTTEIQINLTTDIQIQMFLKLIEI